MRKTDLMWNIIAAFVSPREREKGGEIEKEREIERGRGSERERGQNN